MRGILEDVIRRRVVTPLVLDRVPPGQVSPGAGIGLFIALLPTVGQLYFTTPALALLRAIGSLRFNLPAALAMIGLINPLIKVPLFYGCVVTGDRVLETFGFAAVTDPTSFRARIAAMTDASWHELLDHASRLIGLAFERYALSLAVSGIAWAILAGTATEIGTSWILTWRAERGEKGERSNNPAPF